MDHQGTRFDNNSADRNTVQIFGSKQEPPPDKICDIPDLLSPFFTGREGEIAQIEASFATISGDTPVRCTIYGIPGQGKTQLALQYASLTYKQGRYSHIFWLSAATAEKFNQGFARIASVLRLPARQDLTQADKAFLAKSWLENRDTEDIESESRRKWLLIVDNIVLDTTNLVNSLLPRTNARGRILITTRTAEAAKRISHIQVYMNVYFELQRFSLADSAKLLYRQVNGEDGILDEAELERFKDVAYAVGCLPLAITQAASFMETSGQSPEDFLNTYRAEAEEILDWDSGTPYEGQPVMTTVLLALEVLKTVSPLAIDLLRILSFLDPEAIPIKYLVHGPDAVEQDKEKRTSIIPANTAKRRHALQSFKARGIVSDHTQSSNDEDEEMLHAEPNLLPEVLGSKVTLFKSLRDVQRWSLATMYGKAENQMLKIHTLVQPILRSKLMTEAEQATWLERAISMINISFQKVGNVQLPSTWPECEGFVAQLQSLNGHAEQSKLDNTELLDANDRIALYFLYSGRLDDAEHVLQKNLRIRSMTFGPEHRDTLLNMANLASAYVNKGKWDDAEKLQSEVLVSRVRMLGPEHPDTLLSRANLASTHRRKGRWDDAEKLEIEVMEIRKRVLGPEHPDTLLSMANLASTCRNKGNWDLAEMLELQVMETSKRVLGPEHPDTLLSMGNLASTFWSKGRWDEAEMLEIEVIEIRKRVLGFEHPDTLLSMGNLASTLWNKGKLDMAESLDMQVIELRRRTLGVEHPDTLTSMGNLASTYRNKGKWDEAEILELQVMETLRKVLGPEHPDTLLSMGNLASTFWKKGKWNEAESLSVQVMESRKRVLGPEHPDTLTSMSNLALTYLYKGKLVEAESLSEEVTEIRKRVIGAEHPDTLISMGNLASIYRYKRKWDEAEFLFAQVIHMMEKIVGREHPSTLNSMDNLASTYQDKGNWNQAEPLLVQVIESRKRVLGPEHPDTLASMNRIAFGYTNSKKWLEAEQIFAKLMNIHRKILGAEHPDTLKCKENLENTRKVLGWNVDTSLHGDSDSETNRSITSLDTAVVSWTSSITLDPQADAVDEIATLLVQKLNGLLKIALNHPKIGPQRLTRNLRRLLKIYAIQLSESASELGHHRVVSIIKSQKLAIAVKVVHLLNPSQLKTSFLYLTQGQKGIDRRLKLESYLRGLPITNEQGTEDQQNLEAPKLRSLPPEEFDDSGSDSAISNGSIEQEPEKDSYSFPYVEDVTAFLTNGTAIQEMAYLLERFIEPDFYSELDAFVKFRVPKIYGTRSRSELSLIISVAAELSQVSLKSFRIHQTQTIPIFNQLKFEVELRTKQRWNWWPLPQPVKPLENSAVLEWQCACGKRRYEVLPKWFVGSLERLVERYPQSQPRMKSGSKSSPVFRESVLNTAWRCATSAFETFMSGFSRVHEFATRLWPKLLDTGNSRNDLEARGDNNNEITGSSSFQRYFVFLGISLERCRVLCLEVTGFNDERFFANLKCQYLQQRGVWRSVFSIWQYHHCDFVKFKKRKRSRFIKLSLGVPKASDPDYDIVDSDDPPIPPSEFEDRFYEEGIFSHFRNSSRSSKCCHPQASDDVDRTTELNKLPKKHTDISQDATEVSFYGIHAVEEISFFMVVLYHFFVFTPTVIFCFLWLFAWGHQGDFQNATVPFIVIAICSATFWSWLNLIKI